MSNDKSTKALWEKVIYPHCGEHGRERRGVRQEPWITKGSTCLILLRRRTTACRISLGANVLGVDIAANLVRRNRRAKEAGLANCSSSKATRPIWTR